MDRSDAPPSEDDLTFEADGTAKAASHRQALFRAAPAAPRWRDIQVSRSADRREPPRAGRGFVSRRPPETQKRYETFIRVEARAAPEDDYALLVSGACAILEEEVQALLVRPAAAVGPRLV